MDAKLEKIEDGMKNLKNDVKENDEKTEKLTKMINGRMSKIEEDVKRMKYRNMSSDTLMRNNREKDEKETNEKENTENPAARKNEGNNEKIIRHNSWAHEVEEELENRQNDTTMYEIDKAQWTNKMRKPACWTEGLRATVRPTKEPEREKETKITKETKNAVKHWFGYDKTDDEENSTDDDDDGENGKEWKTVDRKERKKEKEKKRKIKRNMRKEETARKAQSMVGLGPIDWHSYEKELKEENNYEKVKLNLVTKHLRKHYKYDDNEIEQLEILETKITVKDEIFIYIALKDSQDIRDIYRRKAEIRRDDIYLRNYIPPQFFSRFTAINRICRDKRDENPEIKTQVRFGLKDLEIYTKNKGSEEPYQKENLQEFIGEQTIPDFDHYMKWNHSKERPPRRRATSSRNSSPVRSKSPHSPAGRQNRNEKQPNPKTDRKKTTTPAKRKKDNYPSDTSDSCHSEDMEVALEDNLNTTQ